MSCNQCPRKCNIDRSVSTGYCGVGENFRVARAALHFWEEPCISGENGSGTVFFSGCNLKCIYCQNEKISHSVNGKDITDKELMNLFDKLISSGAHNINLVTPTHYASRLIKVLKEYKSPVPVVYNTSGYENTATIKMLEGLVDIYLTDLKYYDSARSMKYSGAENYFEVASNAVLEMFAQTGNITLDNNGVAEKGTLIRHLVLPGNVSQSIKILDWISENISNDIYISIMSQYVPCGIAKTIKPLDRKITSREYKIVKEYALKLGFKNCYFQNKSSGDEMYIPDFDMKNTCETEDACDLNI
ncbi:MAG: 4Fe-4S cluster-binding domain-containing protein [Clostridia bacterium]|nr:4Fe-4S cluster-binding domain-containing protein [Clostridia bacterium]